MKKKVLFLMPSMFIGGAERSFIGVLDAFDYDTYEVYIFLYRHEGEFLADLNSKAILLNEIVEYTVFDRPIKEILFSKEFIFALARLLGKGRLSLYKMHSKRKVDVWTSMQYASHFICPFLPEIPGEYDLAIMFQGIPDALIQHTCANKKIAWIHTDYEQLCPDIKMESKLFQKLHGIVTVSEACKESMEKVYPEFLSKIKVIENILSKSCVEEQAKEQITEYDDYKDSVIICSVGRFSEAKNFDNIPFMCKCIREEGINVHWFLIGYGSDEKLIRDNIQKNRMEKYVHILGRKVNPYPYIKQCDIYVQPSRYEGKAVTIREAQILGKPVVITDFATSRSQLEHMVDGVIVPMDNKACAKGIISVIQNKDLREKLICNCSKRDYTNKNEVFKIYKMMED